MQDISIKFTGEDATADYGSPSCWGVIRIRGFSEEFISPLEWWSCKDYEEQWKSGLKRIIFYDTSCLITYVKLDPKAPLVDRWVLYKEQNIVYVQNQPLFAKLFKKAYKNEPFSLETCYNHIQPRRTKTDCGAKISEWSFELKNLKL